jgi:hypothetical protein
MSRASKPEASKSYLKVKLPSDGNVAYNACNSASTNFYLHSNTQ